MTVAELIEELQKYYEGTEVKRFDSEWDLVEIDEVYIRNSIFNNPASLGVLVIN